MALNPIDKSWSTNKKDIKYVNRDFASLKQALIEFTKTYFPNTNSDFTDASPGMMFIEQAAYVGDVLSYYTDAQLKESFINVASNYSNILTHAQNFGYVPKISRPAITTLTIYQVVPTIFAANGGTGSYEPDFDFCVKIKEGMQVQSQSNKNVIFTTTDMVDFTDATDRTITVLSQTNGTPNTYLLSKTIQAISANILTKEVYLGDSFTPNPTINITDSNFIKIISVTDVSNNQYYEVPYLAQEMIYIKEANSSLYNSDLAAGTGSVDTPYNLKLFKTNKRFTNRVIASDTIQLRFGAASETTADEMIVPNTKNVGLGLNNSISRLEQSFDPSNFLKTSTYGIAPTGKLTVKYLAGGGIASNVTTNDLRKIVSINFDEDLLVFNTIRNPLYQSAKASIAVDNLIPATGGRGLETLDEIRENSIANFASQNRAVTKQDYEIRALSMDAGFGSIAKVYVEQDSNNNPLAINMYTLGYDANYNLKTLNTATKNNLKTYLNEYRLITDAVNILDGYIINIGINFEITTFSNYNKREVVLNCIQSITNYFDINNRKINQPINLSELELELANVDGVATVPKLEIYNICDDAHSHNEYDIKAATKNKIVYPSLDPSIFELKFPATDIKGRAL
jgi:phage-related baseplate assembly protein